LIRNVEFQNVEISQKQKEELINISEGKIGWILDAIKNNELLNDIKNYANLFNNLLTQSFHERLVLLEPCHKITFNLESFLYYLLLWWRDITFIHFGKKNILHFTFEQDLRNKIKSLSTKSITGFLNFLSDIIDDQQYNLNKRLMLENIVVQMPLLTKV